MSALPARRAALAILRVELEDAVPDRLLIHIKTIDDVIGAAESDERVFADPAQALRHVEHWLGSMIAAS